jgi:hypothetical protein
MEECEETSFSTILTNEYLIPNFVYPHCKYNKYYLNKMEDNDKNALIASIIFDSNGIIIPFQYTLTEEQLELYNKNKHDVIDTIVWYMFDISDCKYLVEKYEISKTIKKILEKYAVEKIENIFHGDELYCYYTYYILREYFDNIVYLSSSKNNTATDEDIHNLEKIMNNMTKIKMD